MKTWLLSKGIPLNTIMAFVFALMAILSYYTGMDHSHMCGATVHSFNWFGIGEMPLMWGLMAVAHFLLHDCECPKCKRII
jgi:hypothetical protein